MTSLAASMAKFAKPTSVTLLENAGEVVLNGVRSGNLKAVVTVD